MKQPETVQEARQNGIKVRVTHYRVDEEELYKFKNLDRKDIDELCIPERQMTKKSFAFCRGGKTVVDITLPDGRSSTGTSYCSFSDNFNKKVGTKIALNRAFAKLGGEKESTKTVEDNSIEDLILDFVSQVKGLLSLFSKL